MSCAARLTNRVYVHSICFILLDVAFQFSNVSTYVCLQLLFGYLTLYSGSEITTFCVCFEQFIYLKRDTFKDLRLYKYMEQFEYSVSYS